MDHDNLADGAQPIAEPTPRTRRRARHILDNYYIGPASDQKVLEIWAYTDRMSYQPGDTVHLHVSTSADRWDMEISRDGATYESVFTRSNLAGQHHETPDDCSVNGCDWPIAQSFTIPDDWRSGGYLVTLRGHRGKETVEEHHVFIVRRSPGTKAAPILLVCATGTWLAYNCWGGSNAYDGITGPAGDRFSPRLSTQRPWTRGFCKLPQGAPRTLPETMPKPVDMVRYPYMEWAYAYGYSKKYASAGWASYERHFVQWAEREAYALDIATVHDLHEDPGLLSDYRCAVFVGHDEYWSGTMRDAVDQWVEAGGKAARFAGNFLWQTRIEDDGKTQICHKYEAVDEDPVMETDNQSLLTGAWEIPQINRPGAHTFGVNALKGVYAGLGNCVGRGSDGFTIYRPEHWVFEDAQIGFGDVLGSESRIYGYEVDGLDYVIRDGLPYPTHSDGAPEGLVILGMGMGTNAEADHHIWGETLYIGDGGAIWKAQAIHGNTDPETVESVMRGNGMMVHFHKGKGEVFTAATCEWVMGLTRRDTQVEQITRNVLDRFSADPSSRE